MDRSEKVEVETEKGSVVIGGSLKTAGDVQDDRADLLPHGFNPTCYGLVLIGAFS